MHLLIVIAKSQNRNKNRKRMEEETPAEQQVEQCCFAGVLYVLRESIKLTNEKWKSISWHIRSALAHSGISGENVKSSQKVHKKLALTP